MEQETASSLEDVREEAVKSAQEVAETSREGERESLTSERLIDPSVSADSTSLDLQTLSEIASIVSACASVLVGVALLIAVRQLIVMERSRKLETYTSHLISYGDSSF